MGMYSSLSGRNVDVRTPVIFPLGGWPRVSSRSGAAAGSRTSTLSPPRPRSISCFSLGSPRRGQASLLPSCSAQVDHLDVFGRDIDGGLDALPTPHHRLPDTVGRGLVGLQ